MKKDFSIAEALKFGFVSTFDNFPVLFSMQLVRSLFWASGLAFFWVLFYGFVPTYKIVAQSFFYGHGMYTLHDCFDILYTTKIFLVSMLLAVGDTIFVAALMKIGFEIHDTRKSRFTTLFSLPPSLIFNFIVLNIVYKTIVAVGFLLLLVPGILWAVRFGVAYQAVVDHNVGAFEALRISSSLTKGVRFKLFGFWALILLINLVGYALFVVGTLITMPATMLAQIFVYRRLQGH